MNLEPVILLSCGSFNPVTVMHLRMMELARDVINRTWSVIAFESKGLHLEKKKFSYHKSCTQNYISVIDESETPPVQSAIFNNSTKENEINSCVFPRKRIVIGGILSPVGDHYPKKGLAPASDRIELARIACATTSEWLTVDDWEASQPIWTRTRATLDHFQSRLDKIYLKLNKSKNITGSSLEDNGNTQSSAFVNEGRFSHDSATTRHTSETNIQLTSVKNLPTKGMTTDSWLIECLRKIECINVNYQNSFSHQNDYSACSSHNEEKGALFYPPARIRFVCGADLLESFAIPNLWSPEDIEVIARDYGLICISRPGSNAAKFIQESDILSQYESNIFLVTEWCQNALSSTLVRRAISRGQSIRYLVPEGTIEEIYNRSMYGAKHRNDNILKSAEVKEDEKKPGKN